MTSKNKIPNFLVGGAAKSGTSWIHQCLLEHPDVFVPERKEIRFFSVNYERGEEWYTKFFQNRNEQRVAEEVSPSYLSFKNVPQRIYDWNPDVKIIFVLRDPVRRAFSHYKMLLRSGNVNGSLIDNINENCRFIKDSLYKRNLSRYISQFGRNQVNIFLFEDLKSNNHQFIKNVFECLEVNKSYVPKIINNRHNKTRNIPKRKWLFKFGLFVANKVKAMGGIGRRIHDTVQKSSLSDFYNDWLVGEDGKAEMSDEEAKRLASLFKDDVEYVSEVTNYNISKKWKYSYK
ncbi:hypothetical protein GGP65_001103 [Salinibacter ruber]|uniref:sulfotransferase family protein n=1 Tax=Salinibacter ruber TaxID=146919 RepID=UPI0021688EB4|nr:sulfotransferase [Salinibacter ruber]MCS3663496.1 hypothetical protein [Salinibacter ruber]